MFLPKTEQLDFLPMTLDWLTLGEFNKKEVSLEPISKLGKLKSLNLVRNSKDIDKLSELKQLEHASFTGYPLNQLEFLNKLTGLKSLYLGFCRGENLYFLRNLKKLRNLELLRINNLNSISSISGFSELEWLRIQDQAQITELPCLSNLKKLNHLSLINLKNLTCINSLERSHVKELVILDSNLTIEQLAPLVKSKIKRICINLKRKKETQNIEKILGNRIVPYASTKSENLKNKYYSPLDG